MFIEVWTCRICAAYAVCNTIDALPGLICRYSQSTPRSSGMFFNRHCTAQLKIKLNQRCSVCDRVGAITTRLYLVVFKPHCSTPACRCLPLSFVLCDSLSAHRVVGCGDKGVVSAYLPLSLPLGVLGKGERREGRGEKGEGGLHQKTRSQSKRCAP